MRWPRLTVRWLIVAVAVVAVPLGITGERRSRFIRLADWHEAQPIKVHPTSFQSKTVRDHVPNSNGTGHGISLRTIQVAASWADETGRELSEKEYTRQSNLNDWHGQLATKYRQAAVSPWLPVAPDPPPPE